MIFIFSFLVRILNGLSVLKSFIILKLIEESSISTIDIKTIKKSSLFQLFLRYVRGPMIKPKLIILQKD